jgi:hypothetical protein
MRYLLTVVRQRCFAPPIALLCIGLLSACSLFGRGSPNIPDEEARHRAALAQLIVHNRTDQRLTIAFRSATPPAQEVVLGQVSAGARVRVAPVPAGEPIVLLARRADGAQLALAPRSYPLDAEWNWEIPASAEFRRP